MKDGRQQDRKGTKRKNGSLYYSYYYDRAAFPWDRSCQPARGKCVFQAESRKQGSALSGFRTAFWSVGMPDRSGK